MLAHLPGGAAARSVAVTIVEDTSCSFPENGRRPAPLSGHCGEPGAPTAHRGTGTVRVSSRMLGSARVDSVHSDPRRLDRPRTWMRAPHQSPAHVGRPEAPPVDRAHRHGTAGARSRRAAVCERTCLLANVDAAAAANRDESGRFQNTRFTP
jgi:hypothetical protein